MSPLAGLIGGLIGLLAFGVPAGIRGLPEPAPEVLPEDPQDDTEVQRMLREEGPRERYVEVAELPGLALWSTVLAVLIDLAVGLRLGAHPVTWLIALLVPVLVLLAVVDWRTRLLPRAVVLPATGIVLAALAVEALARGDAHPLVRAVLAMLIARSAFWLLWIVRRAGMGFGDVRLAALLGLVLGRLGWASWLLGLYAGLLLFAVFGITLMLVRRDRGLLKKAFPFGPFMIAGALLGVLLTGSVDVLT